MGERNELLNAWGNVEVAQEGVQRAQHSVHLAKQEVRKLLGRQLNMHTDAVEIGVEDCPPLDHKGNPDPDFDRPDNMIDSPINVCVYDTRRDPACDDCLYCGWPSERK